VKGELILLTDAEARAELDKLGAAFRDDALAGLDALGLLPRAHQAGRDGIPCVALPLVLSATDATSPDTIDRARASLVPLVQLFTEVSAVSRETFVGVLRDWLDRHAVLGDLATLLPMLHADVRESLRGVARAEWRVRQALTALERLAGIDQPTLQLSADSLTGARKRLPTVPSLPSVPARADEAPDRSERWLAADDTTREAIAREIVRDERVDPWVAAVDATAPDQVVPLLLAVADAAEADDAQPELTLRALSMAWSRSDDDERLALGRRRVRLARDAGDTDAELEALEDLLPLTDSLERLTAIKRVAALLEDPLGRVEDATTCLVSAISSGTFDDEMVQKASRMLESARRWPVLLGVLRTAARAAHRPEQMGLLYRRIATVALHHLDDVDEAIALVREGMEATGGDARLASQLVDLAAAASDRAAERAGLEVLVAAGGDHPEARRVDRLLSVILDLGDTDAAVELVERLLALPERDAALDTVLDRRLPEVSEASGDVLARTRWLRRRAERETAPLEALRLWQQVAENEELLGVDPVERLATIEEAFGAAESGSVEPDDIAELYLISAGLQLELGQPSAAGARLARLGQGALRVTGAHDRIGAMIEAPGLGEGDDEMAFDALHGLVLASRDPDLLEAWARVAGDARRWSAATEALELAIDRLAGDEARSASVIRDLARMYERMNAPDEP